MTPPKELGLSKRIELRDRGMGRRRRGKEEKRKRKGKGRDRRGERREMM